MLSKSLIPEASEDTNEPCDDSVGVAKSSVELNVTTVSDNTGASFVPVIVIVTSSLSYEEDESDSTMK